MAKENKWKDENFFLRSRGGSSAGDYKPRINEVVVSKETEGDTDSILEALKMVKAGGIIKVLKGEYNVTSLSSIKNNTKIIGDGNAVLVILNDVGIDSRDGLEFEKIVFEKAGLTESISLTNCENVSFINCRFENLKLSFTDAQTDKITIKNNFFDNANLGADLSSGTGTLFIEGNYFVGKPTSWLIGLYFCRAIVNGNHIEETVGAGLDISGIETEGTTGTITSNYIKAKWGVNSSGCDFAVVGNHLNDCTNTIAGAVGLNDANYV